MGSRVVRDSLNENLFGAEGPLDELHHQESLIGGLGLALLDSTREGRLGADQICHRLGLFASLHVLPDFLSGCDSLLGVHGTVNKSIESVEVDELLEDANKESAGIGHSGELEQVVVVFDGGISQKVDDVREFNTSSEQSDLRVLLIHVILHSFKCGINLDLVCVIVSLNFLIIIDRFLLSLEELASDFVITFNAFLHSDFQLIARPLHVVFEVLI